MVYEQIEATDINPDEGFEETQDTSRVIGQIVRQELGTVLAEVVRAEVVPVIDQAVTTKFNSFTSGLDVRIQQTVQGYVKQMASEIQGQLAETLQSIPQQAEVAQMMQSSGGRLDRLLAMITSSDERFDKTLTMIGRIFGGQANDGNIETDIPKFVSRLNAHRQLEAQLSQALGIAEPSPEMIQRIYYDGMQKGVNMGMKVKGSDALPFVPGPGEGIRRGDLPGGYPGPRNGRSSAGPNLSEAYRGNHG